MSDLKSLMEPETPDATDHSKAKLPVAATDGALNRRDLDVIKRDLITVRKDYSEIRENMIVLTHQYSSAPSKSFFVTFGVIWLALLAVLLTFQPQMTAGVARLMEMIPHH